MESKVKEYQELYCRFEDRYAHVAEVEKAVYDIECEIGQIRERQGLVNYNDTDVVIGYMNEYIDNSVMAEKEALWKEVVNEVEGAAKSKERIQENLDIVYRWLTTKDLDQCLQKITKDYGQHLLPQKAERATLLKIAHILNKIFSFVFRFDFLRFWPKALRIGAGVLFWGIILIPKLMIDIYNKYNTIYIESRPNIPKEEREQAREMLIEEMAQSYMTKIVTVAMILIALNILVYYMARYMAKRYMEAHRVVYLAIVDPDGLRKGMYDYRLSIYMNGTIARWKEEIGSIKKNGFDDSAGDNTLYILIRNELVTKYNAYGENIRACEERIAGLQKDKNTAEATLWDIVPQLKQKETEVNSIVQNSNHNNAVLTPYVSAGYSQFCIYGVKKLLYFEHNYKPVLISCNDESAMESERFVKNAAQLIELLMNGFYQENYYAYINMWLVDFEGLHFPESRTKGLMKVIRTQQGLQELFDEIKHTRETVDSLADGRIEHINPNKLRQHENPIHYNIVYFIGNEFNTVDREIAQLFIDGENYGFLPIVFMKESLVQAMLGDSGSSRIFSKVVAKMQRTRQIYGFEGLVSEFEYGLMVSNQKRLLNEKVCVNIILSMKEFEDIFFHDGDLEFDRIVYVDVHELSEDVYVNLNFSCVRLFTVNDTVPDFVKVDVMRL